MILSWDLGLVFIKGRKVAGTSVETALSRLCGSTDVVTLVTPVDEVRRMRAGASGARNYAVDAALEAPYRAALQRTHLEHVAALPRPTSRFSAHMPLRRVVELAGPQVLAMRVVGVERHPYAKVLSRASYRLSKDAYGAGGPLRSDPSALRAAVAELVSSEEVLRVRNIDLYRRPDGRLAIELLRFEHLRQDVEALFRSLGVEVAPELPHLKRGLTAHPAVAASYLDRAQRRLLDEHFAEEFEAFGYEPI